MGHLKSLIHEIHAAGKEAVTSQMVLVLHIADPA